METTKKIILGVMIVLAVILIISLKLDWIIIKYNPEEIIKYSGHPTCSSSFHTNCEGICQGTQGLVLHYGYRRGICRFETFNETQEDKMWEEFCSIKQ